MSNATDECHRQEIQASFSYPVFFTRRAFDPSNPVLASVLACEADVPRRLLIYLDSGLIEAHPHLPQAAADYARRKLRSVELAAEPRVLPGGERAKAGWKVARQVLDDLAAHRLCRQSYVVVAGGGAVLDAVGFAASLFHRGARVVRLPSTTLAQGDGGVGVKNGINIGGVKNLLGTFAPPYAVVNDLAFLATLPREVMLDGVAEAFKVAIIKDAAFFDFLAENAPALRSGHLPAVERATRRSAALHLGHIREGNDPFEMGAARPLDFGHWSAHRLEGLSDYAIRHGQAVAIGVALDSFYAWRTGLLARDEFDRILAAFAQAGLPTWHPLLGARDPQGRLLILDGIAQFREHLGGRLCITLPKGIGRRVEVNEMDRTVIEEGVRFLRERAVE